MPQTADTDSTNTALLPWDDFGILPNPLQPHAAQTGNNTRLTIVGAGLAGCWLARLLAEDGISSQLLDEGDMAAEGASGNPAGIAKPFVTRSPSEAATFHTTAFHFLLQQLDFLQLGQACELTACGVLQLVNRHYPDSAEFSNVDTAKATSYAGMEVASAALQFGKAGWLNPQALCRQLLDHPLIKYSSDTFVSAIEDASEGQQTPPQWRLKLTGRQDLHSEHIVLALGHKLCRLPQTSHLAIIPARGQLSRFALRPDSAIPKCVISGKHYVIPDGRTVLAGASFERNCTDRSITEHDHRQNLLGLRQLLPGIDVEDRALSGHAGIRATTPDRLPLVGPVPDIGRFNDSYHDLQHGKPASHYPPLTVIPGLHVLGGLGSRGIVTAPYCAQQLATWLKGENRLAAATLLNPARFLIRDLKRGRFHSQ